MVDSVPSATLRIDNRLLCIDVLIGGSELKAYLLQSNFHTLIEVARLLGNVVFFSSDKDAFEHRALLHTLTTDLI